MGFRENQVPNLHELRNAVVLKTDRETETFPTKFQRAFIFFDWYLDLILLWPQTVLSSTTLTALNYLGQFYLQFHSYSLLHEQDFNGVIQTGIKFFAFQTINVSSKTGQDDCMLIYSYICPKKQITFFPLSHPLYLCGWAAAQTNLTLASKFHLLPAKCWYKR